MGILIRSVLPDRLKTRGQGTVTRLKVWESTVSQKGKIGRPKGEQTSRRDSRIVCMLLNLRTNFLVYVRGRLLLYKKTCNVKAIILTIVSTVTVSYFTFVAANYASHWSPSNGRPLDDLCTFTPF